MQGKAAMALGKPMGVVATSAVAESQDTVMVVADMASEEEEAVAVAATVAMAAPAPLALSRAHAS